MIRDRIERICASPRDARTLRVEVLEQLRRAVPFDAYAWLLTDPQTEVGGSPLADVPALPELPTVIRLKYLTPTNRWTRLSGQAVTLARATGGELGRSRFWRELLSHYDVRDVLSAVHRDRHGCWGFLDLWRVRGRFDEDAATFLTSIGGPVTKALRRAQAATFERDGPGPDAGPMIMLLSAALEVRGQTAPAAAALRLLLPTEGAVAPIPAAAYNVAAQLLAVEASIDLHPPLSRVHLDEGSWVTLSAARIGSRSDGDPAPDGRDIAVSIEHTGPTARAEAFGRCNALSPRERELLAALTTGMDTRHLAHRLSLSEHTVQDHLRSIFDKTGLRSRAALAGRAFGG